LDVHGAIVDDGVLRPDVGVPSAAGGRLQHQILYVEGGLLTDGAIAIGASVAPSAISARTISPSAGVAPAAPTGATTKNYIAAAAAMKTRIIGLLSG
jgi:hypothetical protein